MATTKGDEYEKLENDFSGCGSRITATLAMAYASVEYASACSKCNHGCIGGGSFLFFKRQRCYWRNYPTVMPETPSQQSDEVEESLGKRKPLLSILIPISAPGRMRSIVWPASMDYRARTERRPLARLGPKSMSSSRVGDRRSAARRVKSWVSVAALRRDGRAK